MCENVHFITFLQHLYYPFIATIDVLKLIFKNTQLIKLINNLSQDKNRIHDFHIIIKKMHQRKLDHSGKIERGGCSKNM